MTPMKKLMSALLALTFVLGLAATSTTQAEAGSRGRGVAAGVAAGIIGLGILGAAADARAHDRYDHDDRCYPGPEECGYRGGGCYENEYGDEVCRRGRYTCWQRTVCD